MNQNQFFRTITVAFRRCVQFTLIFSLVVSVVPQFSASAQTTGSISGVVEDINNTPITGVEIGVSALDANDVTLAYTCTDSATGNYTITSVPLSTSVKVRADGSGCGGTSYAFEYWQHTLISSSATLIMLTAINPNRTGINFTLAPALPSTEYLFFNLDHSIINELAVRQAIAYGTDRSTISQTAWLPSGEY